MYVVSDPLPQAQRGFCTERIALRVVRKTTPTIIQVKVYNLEGLFHGKII